MGPIFYPEEKITEEIKGKSFGEMMPEEKNMISMRKIALEDSKRYLKNNN